jgi:hypothetical protein
MDGSLLTVRLKYHWMLILRSKTTAKENSEAMESV